ncbi:MAG: hypothetical protein RRY79_01510 [Clostridia bacterium]
MLKGFIHYKNGRIPFVIEKYRMELFTDDSLLTDFMKDDNFQSDYVLTGECFNLGVTSQKITINVEYSIGNTCYLTCFLINQIGHDVQFDSAVFTSELLDCIFRYKYNYLDIAKAGTNLSAETKEVYCIPFSLYETPYELKYIVGHQHRLGLLKKFEMAGEAVVSLNSTDIKECFRITTLMERFMTFMSNSSDVYFRCITLTNKGLPSAFFHCKSISEKLSTGLDVLFYKFDVMRYSPKILQNLAENPGNKITTSMTLGHIGNLESMFTPQRFIEQITAFEYLFEKLEPLKAKQRTVHLVDELEYMFTAFPQILSGIHKNTKAVSNEIKALRVDIVHGHAYYYDFATNHMFRYFMFSLDTLIKCMNLRLAGFSDEEIHNFSAF